MTLAQALEVRPKDVLVLPMVMGGTKEHKVKAVWVSQDRTQVRFQLTGYADQWIHPDMWILLPKVREHPKGTPVALPPLERWQVEETA